MPSSEPPTRGGPLFASHRLMLGPSQTKCMWQDWRGVAASTLTDAEARPLALASWSALSERRPQIELFAVFGSGAWRQRRVSNPGARSHEVGDRSQRGRAVSALKNETSPQNAPSLTARGRSCPRSRSHRPTHLPTHLPSHLPSHLRKSREGGARKNDERRCSLSKLLATFNGNLQDYGSRQQRDADGQADRDPTSSGAVSAQSLTEAEFKRIFGTRTRSRAEVLRANHHQ